MVHVSSILTTSTMKNNKLNTKTFTIQEIWMSTRPNVYNSKKKYTRKSKHKNT